MFKKFFNYSLNKILCKNCNKFFCIRRPCRKCGQCGHNSYDHHSPDCFDRSRDHLSSNPGEKTIDCLECIYHWAEMDRERKKISEDLERKKLADEIADAIIRKQKEDNTK